MQREVVKHCIGVLEKHTEIGAEGALRDTGALKLVNLSHSDFAL